MGSALGQNRTASGRIPARAVGSFVPELTKKAFQKYGFSTAALLTDWAGIVGSELARHTCPERLNWPKRAEDPGDEPGAGARRAGAKLTLRVEPARILDVQYQAHQIKDRINAYFGYAAIADVRFLQAPVAAVRTTARQSTITTAEGPDQSPAQTDDLTAALARLEANIAREGSAG